jgi:hypothetical protein
MNLFMCPNTQCTCKKSLKEGEACPECGAVAQVFSFSDSVRLFKEKERFKKSGTPTIRQDAPTPQEEPAETAQPQCSMQSQFGGKKWVRERNKEEV